MNAYLTVSNVSTSDTSVSSASAFRWGGVRSTLFSNSNLMKNRFSYTYFAKMALLVLTALSVLLLISGSAMAAVDVNTLNDLKAIGSGHDGNNTGPVTGWDMGGEYILKNDIVINESDWVSIGSTASPFTGKFDGNSKNITFGGVDGGGAEITDIVLNNNSVAVSDGFGLFGNIKDAEIHDLKIIVDANLTSKNVNGVIVGNGTGVIVGNSTASVTNSKLSNCHVIFNGSYYIEGNNNVGGLAGYLRQAEITDCSVQGGTIKSASTTAESRAGGLVGASSTELIIKKSFSNTSVLANGQRTGGLVGFVEGTGFIEMENCYFSGDVNGPSQVGGLVGTIGTSALHKSTLTKCYFNGTVTIMPDPSMEAIHVGGLIGYLQSGDISECYSTGTVNGIRIAGGLVGRIMSNTNISDCYSASSVYASGDSGRPELGNYAGGLVGYPNDNLNLSNCYAVGNVVSASDTGAGGLIGGVSSTNPNTGSISNSIVNITNCYSLVGMVNSSLETGRSIGEIYDDAGDNGNFAGIRMWNNILGNFDSNDGIILNVKDNTIFVSKNEVYKNESGWPSFDFTNIWEMATTNYGLPVFVWQAEAPQMTPMTESRNGGGGGTGGATISNNVSSSQPPVANNTPPESSSTGSNDSSQVGNNNGSSQLGDNNGSSQIGINNNSQSGESPKTSVWWYIGAIALVIAVAGVAAYFVKFKSN